MDMAAALPLLLPQAIDASPRLRAGICAFVAPLLRSESGELVWSAGSVIQKLMPSLQAPIGPDAGPVKNEPSGVRSAAFQSETLLPELVTRIRWPSKAAERGAQAVAGQRRQDGAAGRADDRDRGVECRWEPRCSRRRRPGTSDRDPTVTVWRTAPFESSFRSVLMAESVTQMFAPS